MSRVCKQVAGRRDNGGGDEVDAAVPHDDRAQVVEVGEEEEEETSAIDLTSDGVDEVVDLTDGGGDDDSGVEDSASAVVDVGAGAGAGAGRSETRVAHSTSRDQALRYISSHVCKQGRRDAEHMELQTLQLQEGETASLCLLQHTNGNRLTQCYHEQQCPHPSQSSRIIHNTRWRSSLVKPIGVSVDV